MSEWVSIIVPIVIFLTVILVLHLLTKKQLEKGDEIIGELSHPVFGAVSQYSWYWTAERSEPEWDREIEVSGVGENGQPQTTQARSFLQIKATYGRILSECAELAREELDGYTGDFTARDLQLESIHFDTEKEGDFELEFEPVNHPTHFSQNGFTATYRGFALVELEEAL